MKVDPVNANEATKEYLQKKQEAKQHKLDTKKETVKESVSKQAKPDDAPQNASNDLAITCPKCGAKCSSDDNYCAKCGTML